MIRAIIAFVMFTIFVIALLFRMAAGFWLGINSPLMPDFKTGQIIPKENCGRTGHCSYFYVTKAQHILLTCTTITMVCGFIIPTLLILSYKWTSKKQKSTAP